MKHRSFNQLLLAPLTLAVAAFVSCGKDPIASSGESMQPSYGILALGCYDPTDPHCSSTPPAGDPAPDSAGIFLGDDFSFEACTEGGTDLDDDGLTDFCEYQLTLSFRPLLSTNPYDEDLSREPYWAATLNGDEVRMIFMFAYHYDPGNDFAPICQPQFPQCAPHFGDSEWVVANIAFNGGTEHWELVSMITSAHGVPLGYSWSSIEYPVKSRWYPRVYVARNKHANYATRSACNSGGFANSDSCVENSDDDRFLVGQYRNVGSSSNEFIDDVDSENPYLYPGTEYFWTYIGGFCGWDGGTSNCASPGYFEILTALGFGLDS